MRLAKTTVTLVGLAATLVVALFTGRAAAFGHDKAQKPIDNIWDGVYTTAQADRGSKIFHASCGACHGDDLSGTEDGPSLKNAGFFSRWRGQTVGTLVTTAMKSMPKGAPGSLNADEYVDIASFILRANGLPAGESELPQGIRALRVIAVTDAPVH